MSSGIAKIALNIYNTIKNEFVSIPEKPHYTYNMRNHISIIAGMISVGPEQYKAKDDNKKKLLKLLINESFLIYRDRLVSNVDRAKFDGLLSECINA